MHSMDEITNNMESYDLGYIFGVQSAKSATFYHSDDIKGAEVESDLLEIMTLYWSHDEPLFTLLFTELCLENLREGWSVAFLDTIFPLRHLC